jgi:hypothetical protein
MATITASVGKLGGVNRPADVKTIQGMLNQVRRDAGGPYPLLAVDAVCGPCTVNAIQQFQTRQLGWGKADGRVDPGGPTLQRLNELAQSAPAVPRGVLTYGTKMTCPHGARVVVHLTAGPRVKGPDGLVALTPRDFFFVMGCPVQPHGPCYRVQWTESSPFLTERSVGISIGLRQDPRGQVLIQNSPLNSLLKPMR